MIRTQIENNVISAFKQVGVKLGEAAFKPIYCKVYDWAYAGDIGSLLFPCSLPAIDAFSSRDKEESDLLPSLCKPSGLLQG